MTKTSKDYGKSRAADNDIFGFRRSNVFAQMPGGGFGAVFAVDGGGKDASGVSGAFAAGEEVFDLDVPERRGVARDADGRGGAGLDADEDGVACEESAHLAVEGLEPFAQARGDAFGEPGVEGGGVEEIGRASGRERV